MTRKQTAAEGAARVGKFLDFLTAFILLRVPNMLVLVGIVLIFCSCLSFPKSKMIEFLIVPKWNLVGIGFIILLIGIFLFVRKTNIVSCRLPVNDHICQNLFQETGAVWLEWDYGEHCELAMHLTDPPISFYITSSDMSVEGQWWRDNGAKYLKSLDRDRGSNTGKDICEGTRIFSWYHDMEKEDITTLYAVVRAQEELRLKGVMIDTILVKGDYFIKILLKVLDGRLAVLRALGNSEIKMIGLYRKRNEMVRLISYYSECKGLVVPFTHRYSKEFSDIFRTLKQDIISGAKSKIFAKNEKAIDFIQGELIKKGWLQEGEKYYARYFGGAHSI